MSGLPRTRKRTWKQVAGRAEHPDTVPTCQCYATNGEPCTNKAEEGKVFCANHTRCPLSPMSHSEPAYNPERYNSDPAIYKSHNCYSYSMNVIDPKLVRKCKRNTKKNTCRQSFHQPGALNGDRFSLNTETRRTCPVVEKLMISDVPDITKTSFYEQCPSNTSKIALVVDPGEDYHYYRQDSDGMWSHKDGSNKVKRHDAKKSVIANPELASRNYRVQGSELNYEDFCGFYCVPRYDTIRLGQGGSKKLSKAQKLRAKTMKRFQKWLLGK